MTTSFGGFDFEDEEKTYHLIATDHPLMEKLGLSTFTTGTLHRWWNKSVGGELVNRQYFVGGSGSNPIADMYSASSGYEIHSFDVVDRKYSTKNVDVENGNWSFKNKEGKVYTLGSIPDDVEGLNLSYPNNVNGNLDYKTGNFTDQNWDNIVGVSGYTLATAINLNDWLRQKSIKEGTAPVKDWKNEGTVTENEVKSVAAFVKDIKNSASGCIRWSSEIEFNLDGSRAYCTRKEPVNFCLYLYDEKVQRDSSRVFAFKNNTTLIDPVNEFGQPGDTSGPSPVDIPRRSAKQHFIYDSLSGFTRSGSLNMVARLVDDVPPATEPPTTEEMKRYAVDKDVEAFINAFEPGEGTAIPIVNQNRDIKQWGPNLENSKCGEGNKVVEVKVYNLVQRTFAKDTTVLLSQIGGQGKDTAWIIQDFGFEPDPKPLTVFEGKWDFTYLMSNGDSFFKDTSFTEGRRQFTVQSYEDNYRNFYYGELGFGKDTRDVSNAKLNANASLNVPSVAYDPSILTNDRGFYQLTSFDFLARSIGGLREEGHSILQTNFNFPLRNNPEDFNAEDSAGFEQVPFFGCVFPQGYNTKKGDKNYAGDDGIYVLNDIPLTASGNMSSKFFDTSQPSTPFGGQFNDNDAHAPDAKASGLFSPVRENLDNLFNLPADVATLSKYDGENGRPITPLQEIVSHFSANLNLDGYQLAGEYGRRDNVGVTLIDPSGDSFDFEPTNSRELQFRPLMAETAACFYDTPEDTDSNKNEMSKKAKQYTISNTFPVAEQFLAREGLGPLGIPMGGGKENTLDIPIEASDKYYSTDMWGESPAGVVGAITAVCTMSIANAPSVSIDTFNHFGLRPTNVEKTGGSNDYAFALGGFAFGRSLNTPFDTTITDAYFGGPHTGEYNDFQSTALHVRMFGAWPRELTVYDPRYYAVHHFNHGWRYQTKSADLYRSKIDLNPNNEDPSIVNNRIYFGNPFVKETDFRIPTVVVPDPANNLSRYSIAPYESTTLELGDSLAEESEWLIDTNARGKLLPFTMNRLTIGAGSNETPMFVEPSGNIRQTVSANVAYQVDDVFLVPSIRGKDAEMTVAEVDTNGNPTSFIVTDRGSDFFVADFEGNGIPLLEKSVTGKGWQGSIHTGIVTFTKQTWDRPKEVTKNGPQRLTPRSPDGSWFNGVKQQNRIVLSEDVISEDNRYDMYFFFHNDVSHTVAYTGDYGEPFTMARQQKVDLIINIE